MLKGSDVSSFDEGLSSLFKSAGNSGGAVAQSADSRGSDGTTGLIGHLGISHLGQASSGNKPGRLFYYYIQGRPGAFVTESCAIDENHRLSPHNRH
jgi:hypothetical protein